MQTSLQLDDDLLKDLERVRFVSRNFENLQGLYAAWWGLMALSHLLFKYSGWYLERRTDHTWVQVCGNVLEGLSFLGVIIVPYYIALPRLDDYYRKKFGVVQTKLPPLTFPWLVVMTYSITGFLPLHGGQRAYVVIGLSWFVVGLYRPQMDRMALGIGILAFGALKDFLPPWVISVDLSFAFCGAVSFVAGLLDHRLFVNTLGLAQAPAAAATEVVRS